MRYGPFIERFWSRVEKNGPVPEYRPELGPCWIWIGTLRNGYGRINIGGKKLVTAHRWLWEHKRGLVPKGFELDHLCRVRRCVNLLHLEVVTARTNWLRGSSPTLKNLSKTHCQKGHPYDEANTYYPLDRGGRARACKECARERGRQYKARHHERVIQAHRDYRKKQAQLRAHKS